MSIETGFFYVFLIGFVVVALSCFGITRLLGTTIASLPWKWIIKSIIGLIIGLAICYVTSNLGVTAGLIGLVAGFALGFFLLSIIAWAWKVLKWWGKLIIVVTVVLALIATFVAII